MSAQLESARYDPGHRNVLVQLLPAQGISVDFNFDSCQLLVRGGGQDAEAVRREADDPLVVKLNEYRSPISPCSQCGGLDGNVWLIDYGTHRMPFSDGHDVRKPITR
jgi:hypothetical protein